MMHKSKGGKFDFEKVAIANATAKRNAEANKNGSLSADQQNKITELKAAWADADKRGDVAAKNKAHADAESIRSQAGYSGGADGSGHVLLAGKDRGSASGSRGDRSTEAAGPTPSISGMTADQMQEWADKYRNGMTGNMGWDNGYSAAMNLRSMANKIRQQMLANSQAWAGADAETQKYLHDQNLKLAGILEKNNGGAQSHFDESTGQWHTDNGNYGYGHVDSWDRGEPELWGATRDEYNRYADDTDRYSNFVDQGIHRHVTDESSGYTGIYDQFATGANPALSHGTSATQVNPEVYRDVVGDGFNEEGAFRYDPETGRYLRTPQYKDIAQKSDYYASHAPQIKDGVIQDYWQSEMRNQMMDEGRDHRNKGHWASHPIVREVSKAEHADRINGGSGGGSFGGGEGGTGGTITPPTGGEGGGFNFDYDWSAVENARTPEEYLKAMYGALFASQKAGLDAAYQQNLGNLESAGDAIDDGYYEKKRQAAAQAAQQAAGFREVASAQGVNSGAYSQADLAQRNQLQGDLNALGKAEAAAQADLEQKRILLGQQYMQDILAAKAQNDYELASKLYGDAVRLDEQLRAEAMAGGGRRPASMRGYGPGSLNPGFGLPGGPAVPGTTPAVGSPGPGSKDYTLDDILGGEPGNSGLDMLGAAMQVKPGNPGRGKGNQFYDPYTGNASAW